MAPEEGQDFISNLPEDIKCHILSYLPTRAAVQTSVLSSQWRYTWTSIPEVTISAADFVSPRASVQNSQTMLVKFVDAVLDHHKTPISKFKLESDCERDYFNAMDRWILHLSSWNELRELSFVSCSRYLYDVPTSLFSCHGLSVLKLHDCAIVLPRGFQGFKSMCVLELQGCLIREHDLENFVSSCPILVELVYKMGRPWFHNFSGWPSLKIRAPKLKMLIFHGAFASLLLKTPCLVKACFEFCDVPAGIGHCNLVEALGSLPDIQVLSFREHFLEYLLAGSLPDGRPLTFNKLRKLALDVNLASTEEASLILFLLENSPNLLELDLTSSTRDRPQNSVELWQSGPRVFFMSLHVVVLHEFYTSESDCAFLKFILASAPLIEQLKFVTGAQLDADKREAVFEILKSIPKYSRNLQITFE